MRYARQLKPCEFDMVAAVLPLLVETSWLQDQLDAPDLRIFDCGGGIAATSDAFVLTLLGAKDVAVYDGSLVE